MAWQKLGTNTLVSASITNTISVETPTKFIQELTNSIFTANQTTQLRFGNNSIDTSNNYAQRLSKDGGSDGLLTSDNNLNTGYPLDYAGQSLVVYYMINISTEEKLVIAQTVFQNTAGAGTAPSRSELAGKWSNTSNQSNRFQALSSQSTQAVDSNLTVLGSD
jgi:hypothetical protein